MIRARKFNPAGMEAFRNWLAGGGFGGSPAGLIVNPDFTEPFADSSIDPLKQFASRYEFGLYLRDALSGIDAGLLLSPEGDGLWAWINAVYFSQLAPTAIRRAEHYIPIRRGTAGSLLHRNAARTAFELVLVHGPNARFALQQPMHIHGQLLESLSASQSVARNRGFFAAAATMYVGADGKLKRGATSKPKNPRDRKPGDEAGKGSIRRLPTALKRLDLTYDVDILAPDQLISMLPREYARWTG